MQKFYLPFLSVNAPLSFLFDALKIGSVNDRLVSWCKEPLAVKEVWGSIPWLSKLNAVSPIALLLLQCFFVAVLLSVKPRRRAPPLVTCFGVAL